ncbi:TetR/AcrR family transcriptional regulator [Rhodococcus sp. IEGM 1408]|uniref:TetR/AcrR family transcriptional regulator n=1 Tax=Rhodococcus sp. IEGM 1408 TaxID=3082220 RepID=UPI0029551D9C|nr:TetR/AcrR family transcriptional regulator [Rhodococcus sp. IEGM 1408]MDV7999889.1 TetR/AcrR family transcriptional regulator [Rhodococcus sp. IEGM 1408]
MASTPRPYRGVSAEERRSARRRQLLDAALELAGTRGVERATMTAICAQAGLTERYFYESFTARDQLLLTLVDEIAEQLRAAVLAALAQTEGDTAARAHAAIAAFAALLTDDPRKGRVAIIESATVPALRQRRHELFRDFAALVATQAQALFGDRALPAPRDEISARLLVGGLGELITAWLQAETSAGIEDIVDEATRWFTAGMHT